MNWFFGSKPKRGSSHDEVPEKGWFGSVKKTWTKRDETSLNKYWAKKINKRDILLQEFINLKEWGLSPLIPRSVATLRSDVGV